MINLMYFLFKVQMSTIPVQGLPASLQYLNGLDRIIIKQKIELLEG